MVIIVDVIFNGKMVNKKYENYDELVEDLYYNLGTIDDKENKEIIKDMSMNTNIIPMYDIYMNNIVLVKKDDLYYKLIEFDNRPINMSIMENIKSEKLLNFMKNFDIELLELNFYRHIYKNAPNTTELTECIRPSFTPYLKTTTPYYTKQELLYLALNMNILDLSIFNTNERKTTDVRNTKQVCEMIRKNDVNGEILLKHQEYIRINGMDNYIKFYSFLGSGLFNNYLRNNSNYNKYIELGIVNFRKYLLKSPSWDKEYYFYRWINDDKYLKNIKIGDIWIDNSFMSTTRKAFIDPDEHYFGYILIKIKVPKDREGCGLAIEHYSNFAEEQEILFPPSKYRLVDNKHVKYYHPNSKVKDKITSKYVFEWIGHNENYLKKIDKNEIDEIKTLDLDTYVLNNIVYEDNVDKFKRIYKKMCKIRIGKEMVIFNVNEIEGFPYSKFFYLNNEKEQNGLYLTWIDYNSGNINLILEISKEIMSINYYFKYSGMEVKTSISYTYDDIMKFIEIISNIFKINTIIIHPDYRKYLDITKTDNNLCINDSMYYNQYIYNYLIEKDKKNLGFMSYMNKNNQYINTINKESLNYIMNISLKDFLYEYLSENDTIYNSHIELIFRLVYKLIKRNNEKVIDLYMYLMYNYCYLVEYFYEYINDKYDIDINTSHYIYRNTSLLYTRIKEVSFKTKYVKNKEIRTLTY